MRKRLVFFCALFFEGIPLYLHHCLTPSKQFETFSDYDIYPNKPVGRR